MTSPLRILGIDPGLNRTGYAVLAPGRPHPQIVEAGVLRSTAGLSLAERLREIASGMRDVLAEFRPSSVALEQVFSHVQFPKTAILMAHARGALLFTIADTKTPVVHYTATQVKRMLTGSGKASKVQIQLAVQRELSLATPLEPNDVADAAAIALCHWHTCRLTNIVPG